MTKSSQVGGRRWFSRLFCLHLFFAFSAHALKLPCRTFLEELNKRMAEEPRDDLKALLAALHPEGSPPPTANYREGYRLILGDILRGLPAAVVENILAQDAALRPKNSGEFSGGHAVLLGRIQMWVSVAMPERYHGTPVEFEIRIHEIYHAIEWQLGRLIPGYRNFTTHNLSATYIFLKETGAMLAEWRYLHSLPEHVRKYWMDRLAADRELDKHERGRILRRFRNAHLSAEEYLNAEWAAGRYSREQTGRIAEYRFKWLAGTVLFALYTTYDIWRDCRNAAFDYNWAIEFNKRNHAAIAQFGKSYASYFKDKIPDHSSAWFCGKLGFTFEAADE